MEIRPSTLTPASRGPYLANKIYQWTRKHRKRNVPEDLREKGGMSIPTRAKVPKESTTYQKERSHQSWDTSCIRSILKMSENILSDGGEFTTTKKGQSGLMNSRGTPETNMGMTVMPRRRHHMSHQGQEEKLRKTTTDKRTRRGKRP